MIAGSLFTLILSLLYLYQPRFLRFLDSKSYDTFVMTIDRDWAKTEETPVIIDIDEKSLAKYGQWPWPRYRLALLLDRLMELGPSSIGLDTILAEADRTSFSVLKQDIYRDLKINIPIGHIPKALQDNDKTLAAIISHGLVVLGFSFTFTENKTPGSECRLHPLNVAVVADDGVAPDPQAHLFRASGVICNLSTLSEGAAGSGFLNIPHDMDGILRRVPLVVEYKGKFYPSLALATLMRAKGINQVFLKISPEGIEALRLDHTLIPVDGKGNLLINYRGRGGTFTYLSAADILERAVTKELLAGRIIFIGSSATGIADFHPTPVDNVLPGVEIHATVVDNIQKREFLSRPSWIPGLELMLVVAAGLLSTLLLIRMSALWSLLSFFAGALGLWLSSLWLLQYSGIFVSPIVALIALGSNFTLVTLLKFWYEEREKRARTKEVLLTQDFTIRCLASLTECRDSETGGHILRTQAYVAAICQQLSTDPSYATLLDEETREHLYKSSPLHDIGKVGVPDHILLKPGKLTPEEFDEMKRHTTYGRDAIQRAEEKFGIGDSSEFLRLAKEIAYTHHEKWDGTGYPKKLKGEEIPLSGRIMALADVYDALVCQRVYKPALPHEDAVALIVQLNGIIFDPGVISAFLAVNEQFKKISIELADHNDHTEALAREHLQGN